MKLSGSQLLELEAVVKVGYDGSVSDRAAMVLAWADDESVARIAERFGVSRPTVYKWAARFEVDGLEGLVNRVSTGRPRTVPGSERARILAVTKSLSHVVSGRVDRAVWVDGRCVVAPVGA